MLFAEGINSFGLPAWMTGGVAGGLLIAFVVAMWGRIKSSIHYITNYFIYRVHLGCGSDNIVMTYLVRHCKVSAIRDRVISVHEEVSRQRGQHELVLCERVFDQRQPAVLVWVGWAPALIRYEAPQKDHHTGWYLLFYFIRGTIDVDKLLKDAMAEYSSRCRENLEAISSQRSRFFIRAYPTPPGEQNEAASLKEKGSSLPWYQQDQNRLISHNREDLGPMLSTNGKALDNLFFPEEIESLQHEIILWRSSREWYRERGLPWKRGWLLHGKPGCGKTALARSFAEDLDMPIFVFNLGELNNGTFRTAWRSMQFHVPCIALIEDIDGVFHGRDNISKPATNFFQMFGPHFGEDEPEDPVGGHPPAAESLGGHSEAPPVNPGQGMEKVAGTGKKKKQGNQGMPASLTFDCLLNVLDGVDRLPGVFVMITTNDITKVDEAIGQPVNDSQATRPGRIDRVIELTYMTKNDKKRMIEKTLKGYPDEIAAMKLKVDNDPEDFKETPSQFQERCAQVALAKLWSVREQDRVKAAQGV